MRRKLGTLLVAIGFVLILGSLALFLSNYREQEEAGELSARPCRRSWK